MNWNYIYQNKIIWIFGYIFLVFFVNVISEFKKTLNIFQLVNGYKSGMLEMAIIRYHSDFRIMKKGNKMYHWNDAI